MDLGVVVAAVSLILGAGVLVGSSIVAIVVARRRGLDQVDARTDSEVQKAADAMERRLALQDREIQDLKNQVAALQLQVATLTTDLHTSDSLVRRLSAQVVQQGGDGR